MVLIPCIRLITNELKGELNIPDQEIYTALKNTFRSRRPVDS